MRSFVVNLPLANKEISMGMDDIIRLCDQVRETSYAIHLYHGNG